MVARLLVLALLLLLPGQGAAREEVVLGLSEDRISINTSFTGSQILIYGAVKREAPPEDAPLGVIITVEGPDQRLTVRRKTRQFGIWINTDAVVVDSAPSFYAVATTGPLEDILTSTEDLRRKISINRAIRAVGAPDTIRDAERFTEAIIRIRERANLYQQREGRVDLRQETLFSTAISMPSELVEGVYDVRIFLTRKGEVISEHDSSIDVRKVGLERWLFALAHARPFFYGLMSLAVAILAGWGASEAFRKLRNW
ncbi:conserved hypothetical protein [Pontibaca methylaminivorans]|uniref:Transmembrane protein (Alph_Pro_TM) n=2 Tax=Pontibaca methylaminivorans TaxID=515897 RepID=A0A1R3WWQ0_9RHOB|nr:conserved hypothetical protein [Pontibaca methylaminivorans]